jgi:enterochelin esterase-like enzyme
MSVRSASGVAALVAALVASTACTGSSSPGGSTLAHGTLQSSVVAVGGGAERRVAVYLPPGALPRGSGGGYPTLYLLHGAGADESQWPAIGVTDAADRLIADGSIPPLVIVMPDIDADGQAVLDAVVPWAEAHLPVVPDAAHRAIGGISRGGATALRLASARPYRFSRVGGHSPAVPDGGALAQKLAAWGGPVWLDVGTHDSLKQRVGLLSSTLEGDGTVAQFHLYDGGHNRDYWGAHVEDYLRFYGGSGGVDGGQVDDQAGAAQG